MSNIGNSNMRYVTFIVTQNCNLNCTYCYEHNKTKNSFDVNLAKEIILRELSIKDNYTEICFDFFGGEPFLEFDKIKEIVEFFKDRKFDKKVYFFAGTNGTLINKDIQKYTDKAVSKGLIKKNTADREKSRLTQKIKNMK